MSMEFVRPAPPKKHPLYFVSGTVDWAVIGGISVLYFAVVMIFNLTGSSHFESRQDWGINLAVYLSWIINWPHFSATNYRLYNSKRNMMQYPFTAFVVPVLVLAGLVASFADPRGVAPFYAKLFLIWSPYHFSGQSVGITMIYARRGGFQVGKFDRMALSGFIFGTYLYSTARSEALLNDTSYYDIKIPFLGIPPEVSEWIGYGMYACGAALLVFFVARCLRDRKFYPPIILLPALAQYIWFVHGGQSPTFNEFVPMFHSLQYLLIAWSMQIKEQVDLQGIAPTGRFAAVESSRWFVINVAGGALLFSLLPKFAGWAGSPPLFAEGVILSAIQIHHFFVDGVIWKLKNPKVSSPLLVNIPELIRGDPKPAGAPA